MRLNDKQWKAAHNKDVFDVNFHQFLELEGQSNHMEIAEELGISLGEVKRLKGKITRT